jgi:hypothetical protein
MDNPETLATLGAQDTGRRQAKQKQSRDTGNIGCTRHRTKTSKTKNTTQKTKKMSNTDAHKMPRVNTGGRDICLPKYEFIFCQSEPYYSKKLGATSGTGTAHPSGAHSVVLLNLSFLCSVL